MSKHLVKNYFKLKWTLWCRTSIEKIAQEQWQNFFLCLSLLIIRNKVAWLRYIYLQKILLYFILFWWIRICLCSCVAEIQTWQCVLTAFPSFLYFTFSNFWLVEASNLAFHTYYNYFLVTWAPIKDRSCLCLSSKEVLKERVPALNSFISISFSFHLDLFHNISYFYIVKTILCIIRLPRGGHPSIWLQSHLAQPHLCLHPSPKLG